MALRGGGGGGRAVAVAVEAAAMGRGPGGGGFGGMGPATTRRYNLTFSVNARNVLNKVNAATPIGILSLAQFRTVDCSGGWAVLEPGGESKN